MSDPTRGSSTPRVLPARANLEHLKNEAKQRLATLRAANPDMRLAEAQFAVARDYGFSSWRALKTEVERRAGGDLARYAGYYREDPERITNSVATVRVEDGRLSIQMTGGPRLRLMPRDDGSFVSPGLSDGDYRFEGDVLFIRNERGTIRLQRTGAEEADRAAAGYAAALAGQKRPRTPTAVPTDILDRYVGFYSNPLGPPFEITREGDQLFSRAAGQQKLPLLAESETDFFLQVAPAQLAFVTEDSRAVAAILRQAGHDVWNPRISAEEARRKSEGIERKAAEQLRPRTAIAIDPALLSGYVGSYQAGAGCPST